MEGIWYWTLFKQQKSYGKENYVWCKILQKQPLRCWPNPQDILFEVFLCIWLQFDPYHNNNNRVTWHLDTKFVTVSGSIDIELFKYQILQLQVLLPVEERKITVKLLLAIDIIPFIQGIYYIKQIHSVSCVGDYMYKILN